MKAFILAFILVVACQAEETGMCNKTEAADAPLEKIVNQTKVFLLDVFEGSCKVDGGSFVDYFFKPSTGCAEYFKQGYCYFFLESKRTDPLWGLTFDQIKKAIPDIGELAGILCANKCTLNILPKIFACYKDPVVKPLIVKKISAQFLWAKGEAEKYQSILEGSPLGRILNVGLNQWKTWPDVGLSIRNHKAGLVELISDFRNNFGYFCTSNCSAPSAKYLLKYVTSMNIGKCEQPRSFCGACQETAKVFVAGGIGDNMPCCLKNFYDFIIRRTDNGANGYISGNGVLLGSVAYLSTQNEDFQCIRGVYDPVVKSLTDTCAKPEAITAEPKL